jgi:hypothetical protein
MKHKITDHFTYYITKLRWSTFYKAMEETNSLYLLTLKVPSTIFTQEVFDPLIENIKGQSYDT